MALRWYVILHMHGGEKSLWSVAYGAKLLLSANRLIPIDPIRSHGQNKADSDRDIFSVNVVMLKTGKKLVFLD